MTESLAGESLLWAAWILCVIAFPFWEEANMETTGRQLQIIPGGQEMYPESHQHWRNWFIFGGTGQWDSHLGFAPWGARLDQSGLFLFTDVPFATKNGVNTGELRWKRLKPSVDLVWFLHEWWWVHVQPCLMKKFQMCCGRKTSSLSQMAFAEMMFVHQADSRLTVACFEILLSLIWQDVGSRSCFCIWACCLVNKQSQKQQQQRQRQQRQRQQQQQQQAEALSTMLG